MRRIITLVLGFVVGLFAITASATSMIDFLEFGGITYANRGRRLGRELRDEDLGAEVTKVKFKSAWVGDRPAPPPSYGPDEAYAASLETGTSVYAVKGYTTTFRLAARKGEMIVLFEADTNPKAHTGSDYLDLNQVVYIGVNSEQDGVTEIAAIKDPAVVTNLVRKVLDARIQDNSNNSGPRYFIVFHLRDGTRTAPRSYWLNSGELWLSLSRGIMLPRQFATAVREALKRAERTP